MKFSMFLRIKMCMKIHMISLLYYGKSGDKVQDETTEKNT